MDYKRSIAESLNKLLDMDVEWLKVLIEKPPCEEMGDYAFPCYHVSKFLKESPHSICKQLKNEIYLDKFERIESKGPYLNFFISKGMFIKDVIEHVLEFGDTYGASYFGRGKNIFIEYTEVDIFKFLNFRYVHTTAVRNSLKNIFNYAGFNCFVTNSNDLESAYDMKLCDKWDEKFHTYLGGDYDCEKLELFIKELELKGMLIESNGVKVVFLKEFNLPPLIIKRQDNTYTSAVKTMAAAIEANETYNTLNSLYVATADNSLYYRQIFATMKLLEHQWVENCEYVNCGGAGLLHNKLLNGSDNLLSLMDVLKSRVNKDLLKIFNKNNDLTKNDKYIEKIAANAILFSYLKKPRNYSNTFNLDEVLSKEEGGGLFIQYTYENFKSKINNMSKAEEAADLSLLNSSEEFEIAKLLYSFKEKIIEASEKREPYLIADHIFEICKAAGEYEKNHKIFYIEDEDIRNAKAMLLKACSQVIKNGLYLLGIEEL